MAPTNATLEEDSKFTVVKKPQRLSKKGAGQPSRPLSAYNYFFREQRAKILEEREEEARATGVQPDKSDLFAILGKTIAARWKELDDEKRQKYKDMAADDMKRYRAAMDEYHETIAKSIRVGKGKKKNSKKALKKAAKEDDSVDGSREEKKPKAAKNASPRQMPSSLPKGTPNGSTPQVPPAMAGPNSMAAMAGFRGAGSGIEASGLAGADNLDMLAYQNLMRQRELQALREQSMGLSSGLGGSVDGGQGLLRGSMGGQMGYMGAGGSSSGFFGGGGGTGAPGLMSSGMGGMGGTSMLPGGYAPGPAGGAGGYPGIDMSMQPEMAARSGLTPEEQLYLLRRNQEEMDLSIRQRLELMQQQQARQMQLMEMQQHQQQQPQLAPGSLAMMQERQRFLERQRLEQLLAAQGGAPTGGY